MLLLQCRAMKSARGIENERSEVSVALASATIGTRRQYSALIDVVAFRFLRYRSTVSEKANRKHVLAKYPADLRVRFTKLLLMIADEVCEIMRRCSGKAFYLEGRIDVVMSGNDVRELHDQAVGHPA